MSAEKEVAYAVTADPTGFERAMARMAAAVQQAQNGVGSLAGRMQSQFGQATEAMGQQMRAVGDSIRGELTGMAGHFGGVLDVVGQSRAGLIALTAAAVGFAGVKAASAAAATTESVMDLGRVLGSTTNEAQQWRIALQDVGAEQSDLEGAAKGLSRQLRENEADLNKMGLRTRDAAGQLRPMVELLAEGIEVVNGYRQGADRALAAQTIFGRGVDASSKLLLVNKEALEGATATVADLNLHVGANAVAAWGDFDAASDRAGFSLQGLGRTVGTAVMPVVTDLINLFNGAMPAAITVVQGALGGLLTAWYSFTNGAFVSLKLIETALFTLADPILTISRAVSQAMTGNFSGAWETIKGGARNIEQAWGAAFDAVAAKSAETRDRIAALWSPDIEAGTPVGAQGTQDYTDPSPKKQPEAKEKAAPSAMPSFELELQQARTAAIALQGIRGMTLQQEQAFWEAKSQLASLSAGDQAGVARKLADVRLGLLRQEVQQQAELQQVNAQAAEQAALGKVEAEAQATRALFDQEQISKAALLQLEQQFELQRQAIRNAALSAQLEQLDPQLDPVKVAQLQATREQQEREHQQRLGLIRNQLAQQGVQQQAAVWGGLQQRMSSLWDQGINAIMNRTFTWQGAMRAVGTQVVGWFANSVIKPKVTAWLFGEQAQTGATIAGTAARTAAEGSAAAFSIATWAATAVKNIMTNAWAAMAAAWQAMVGIPYVGPVLAVAAAAAAFAGVSALAGKVASAEGGYDIPAGVNPMTQLHEKEMVLPAKHADVIRSIADTGGTVAGALGGGMNVTLQGQRYGNFFIAHRDDFVAAFKSAKRDGALK